MGRPEDFIVPAAAPSYRRPDLRPPLAERVAAARRELQSCRACPRECGVNRAADEEGYCGVGRLARVASAFPHFGEEECLRGTGGSGTIFFSGCNLRCVFCQNWDISQARSGQEMGATQIAELMLSLQRAGCHNINLVTPEHVVPQVIEALAAAIDRGLSLPVVYNTSAYDSVRSLQLLDGLVDIYMPDFKFWTPQASGRFCHAADYPERAREAIREMHRQVGDLRFTPDGAACRGLLVRQLVMPGLVDESRAIYQWLATELSADTFVNIMAQYRPENEVGRPMRGPDGRQRTAHAEINRRPTSAELAEAHEAARAAGLWRFDNN